jgi:preprotein translocase subunit SecA
LGRQTLTEIYRQLLLGVITELWVDYLTQMEALRISIGLEAYAQRDPLVQYKSRAFGLFQDLLNNMRSGVVARMFTYQPRDLGSVQTTISRADSDRNELEQPEDRTEAGQPEDSEAEERVPAVSQAPAQQPTKADRSTDGKKRRRRRH